MPAKEMRLPVLSIALSLSFTFCARADICFDTMTNAKSSAYIVHTDEDENTLMVEITGDYEIKSLLPAGSSEEGIPRDMARIRIPEIKMNMVENPHAEYHDFFETMEDIIGLSGKHEGFLNTKILRASGSIRMDSEEYTDYNGSGRIEMTFMNNREFQLDSDEWQSVRFVIPDPPEIELYYKDEKHLGERFIYEDLPDEFLLHDIYLGAYALHAEKMEKREQMMERLLRLRYQDLYYQIRYDLHEPSEEDEEADSKNTYQELMENLSYISLPNLSFRASAVGQKTDSGRYDFLGWKLTELGEGAVLSGPCRSEEIGLPLTKIHKSPMLSFLNAQRGIRSVGLYDAVRSEQMIAETAAVTVETMREEKGEEKGEEKREDDDNDDGTESIAAQIPPEERMEEDEETEISTISEIGNQKRDVKNELDTVNAKERQPENKKEMGDLSTEIV